MSFSKLTTSSAVLAQLVAFASAQGTFSNSIAGVYTITQDTGGDIPLISKHFEWPDLPYQADTGTGPRGTQQGYNLCNSTTQNQNSWCQTAFMNSIDDFCLWGSPVPDSTVGAIEEEMVAYCTKPKYGTRMIPQNALQGVQWIVTPDYVEVVGYIDQTVLQLQSNDTGGEEDPHGADNRGNPLGSLLYSSAFLKTNPNDKNYTQVIEWSYFVGSGIFCFKACDPAGANAASLCQHTYDEVGCVYNDPANYGGINGTFTSCQGEDQLPVGVYVTNGVTSTWAQPASFTAVPYTPSIPATSSCTTYTSSALYTALVTSTTTTTTSATSTSSKSNSSKGSATGSSSTATSTGSNSSSSSNHSGAVSDVRMSGVALIGSLLGSFAALGWALI